MSQFEVVLYSYYKLNESKVGFQYYKLWWSSTNLRFQKKIVDQPDKIISRAAPILRVEKELQGGSYIIVNQNKLCSSQLQLSGSIITRSLLYDNLFARCSIKPDQQTMNCSIVRITSYSCELQNKAIYAIRWGSQSTIRWRASYVSIAQHEIVVQLLVSNPYAARLDKSNLSLSNTTIQNELEQTNGQQETSVWNGMDQQERVIDIITLILQRRKYSSGYIVVNASTPPTSPVISMKKLALVQQQALAPGKYLLSSQLYRSWYGTRMLQSKLLHNQNWYNQISMTRDCKLVVSTGTGTLSLESENLQPSHQVLGIRFGWYEQVTTDLPLTPEQYKNISIWNLCRVVINTGGRELVLSADLDNRIQPPLPITKITKPYITYVCGLDDFISMHKCKYQNKRSSNTHKLPISAKVIIYFVNRGQMYHINIREASLYQRNPTLFYFCASAIWILALAGLLGFISFICIKLIQLEPLWLYIRVQLGNRRQMRWRYPLTDLTLSLKLHQLKKQQLISEYKLKPSPSSQTAAVLSETYIDMPEKKQQTTCIHCLENMKVGERIISFYCGHFYHRHCCRLQIQKLKKVACPICRRQLTKDSRDWYLSQKK